MKFKQRPREEQAEADGTAEAEKVKFQLSVIPKHAASKPNYMWLRL